MHCLQREKFVVVSDIRLNKMMINGHLQFHTSTTSRHYNNNNNKHCWSYCQQCIIISEKTIGIHPISLRMRLITQVQWGFMWTSLCSRLMLTSDTGVTPEAADAQISSSCHNRDAPLQTLGRKH